MDKWILAAYSGLTVSALMVCILGLTVLAKCIKDKDFGTTFIMSVGFTLWAGFQFIDRGWWTVWKNGYISRKSVSWMLNHEMALINPLMMITGMLCVILSLTQDSPNKRIFNICVGVVLCVIFMAYLKR